MEITNVLLIDLHLCGFTATPGDIEEASNEVTPGERAGLDNIPASI